MEDDPPISKIWSYVKKKFWEIFQEFDYLCIMVNKLIDIYVEDFMVYHHKGWYWIINPVTREWIVNVADSGYTFFNRDFWKVVSKLYPSEDITNDIRNWIVYKLGVPFSKHCHPDYIDGDYDWRDEFGGQLIIDVINKGEKIK